MEEHALLAKKAEPEFRWVSFREAECTTQKQSTASPLRDDEPPSVAWKRPGSITLPGRFCVSIGSLCRRSAILLLIGRGRGTCAAPCRGL